MINVDSYELSAKYLLPLRGSNTMEGSRQYYKMVTEFSLNVQDLVRRVGQTSTQWAGPEAALQEAFNAARLVESRSNVCSKDSNGVVNQKQIF